MSLGNKKIKSPSTKIKGAVANEKVSDASMQQPDSLSEKNPTVRWGFITGLIGLVFVGLIFLLNPSRNFNNTELFFLRVILALSAAAFSLIFTGYLKVKYEIPGGPAIESGGAAACFIIVLVLFPHFAIGSPYKVIMMEDHVDLRSWRPYKESEISTVPVYRNINLKVLRNRSTDLDYNDTHGTSNLNGLEILPITRNLSFRTLENTTEIGRTTYQISIPNREFESLDTLLGGYRITYWNCFKLDSPHFKKNDITKMFPYPTENYTLKVFLPKKYTWSSIVLSATSMYNKTTTINLPIKDSDTLLVYSTRNIDPSSSFKFFFNDFKAKP
jgi:hypothetical protein